MRITSEEWIEIEATIDGMTAALSWADRHGRTITEWRLHPEDVWAIRTGRPAFFRVTVAGGNSSALGVEAIQDATRPRGEGRALIASWTVEVPK